MSAPFRQIGPYVIDRQLPGGRAMVFLARDTTHGDRVVALKVLQEGVDDDSAEWLAAERRGAELQQRLLADNEFVPEVYEIGQSDGYLYIAMEFVDGENLSSLIERGPIDWRRAIPMGIQFCRFLEEIDHLDLKIPGGSPLTLLHNDLKPRNVRVMAGDRIKIVDFGAAKTLPQDRRATRNEYYSTPYLSPECLESGERDRHADAWAVGVMLYEMVTGRAPFRGDNTVRLEDRIRSRRPPEPATGCPRTLQAVLAKLLAPYAADRYATPEAIRGDLERALADEPTEAEQQGWPERVFDEPPTRPVRPDTDDEPPTRRTPRTPSERRPPAAVASTMPPILLRVRRWAYAALFVLVAVLGGNEACVMGEARHVAATVPLQDLAGVTAAWNSYDQLRARSYLHVGASGLGRALQQQTLVLAERVTSDYRSPTPTVREAQWSAVAAALERAAAAAPSSSVIRGTLRYAQGHLRRIDGEADKGRRQLPKAQRNFNEAVAAFREAAAARPDWPDPFLGLARTFIYGLEDVDRGADAIARAQKLGYATSARDTVQLADGYRARGDALEHAAAQLGGVPQEREFLGRSRDAYQKALELYTKVAEFGDATAQVRTTQHRIEIIDRKVADLDARSASSPAVVAPAVPSVALPARDRSVSWA
ncbi:MAG: serine/threonine-protein kinase [Acidobacteriota bacterium]